MGPQKTQTKWPENPRLEPAAPVPIPKCPTGEKFENRGPKKVISFGKLPSPALDDPPGRGRKNPGYWCAHGPGAPSSRLLGGSRWGKPETVFFIGEIERRRATLQKRLTILTDGTARARRRRGRKNPGYWGAHGTGVRYVYTYWEIGELTKSALTILRRLFGDCQTIGGFRGAGE